ncbi:MAG: sugar phosphate nucleotidyltransferase [Bacteroidia bacterium]|nr:sugar phosphate nucleotidyltransferase [Bacteroidia bacterium]
MAAGKGTRLGKISETFPKVLLDINGKSLLRLAVENCTAFGFDDIIINVHHLADMVEEEIAKLRKDGFSITVSDERSLLLETAGGLFKARDFFNKEPFLLCNADTLTDLDLSAMYRYHLKMKGLATLAVRDRIGKRYFLVDQQGRMKGWCNKATGERIVAVEEPETLSEIAFSGRHIIDPEIFNYMSDGICTMTALYLHLAESHNIYTFREDGGYWFNVGTPEDLKAARNYLQK